MQERCRLAGCSDDAADAAISDLDVIGQAADSTWLCWTPYMQYSIAMRLVSLGIIVIAIYRAVEREVIGAEVEVKQQLSEPPVAHLVQCIFEVTAAGADPLARAVTSRTPIRQHALVSCLEGFAFTTTGSAGAVLLSTMHHTT